MAHKYPYSRSRQALYFPAKGPGFFEDWDLVNDTANHDLLCAEMSRLAYCERDDVDKALRRIDFALKLPIGGETLKERGEAFGVDGFVATRGASGPTVLAFRGTEGNKPEDLLADGLANSTPWDPANPSRGLVHEGFALAYRHVRGAIAQALDRPAGQLLITGHSLGAAAATLAAAEHAATAPKLITFGSPRVGDSTFASLLDGLKERGNIHRFVDCCDLVTRVPPKSFDQAQIDALLTELIPEELRDGLLADNLISGVAFVLAEVLARLDIQPTYEHVGTLQHRDRSGRPLSGETAIGSDQRTARTEYAAGAVPAVKDLVRGLGHAVRAAGSANGVRDAVRAFGSALSGEDSVLLLRDFADHTPLNYVSLFTGRE